VTDLARGEGTVQGLDDGPRDGQPASIAYASAVSRGRHCFVSRLIEGFSAVPTRLLCSWKAMLSSPVGLMWLSSTVMDEQSFAVTRCWLDRLGPSETERVSQRRVDVVVCKTSDCGS
jgi:hypothetical protein